MDINILAVFVTALVVYALGALWYSPLLFGKQWMKLSGVHPDMNPEQKKRMGVKYFLHFVSVFITVLVFDFVLGAFTVVTIGDGLLAGVILWLGFALMNQVSPTLWEGKSWKLFLLNGAYSLVFFLVAGIILTLWV